MDELLKVPTSARRCWTAMISLALIAGVTAAFNKPETISAGTVNDQVMSAVANPADTFELAMLTAEAQFEQNEVRELPMVSTGEELADMVSFVAKEPEASVEDVSHGAIVDDEEAEVFSPLTLSGLDRSTVSDLLDQGKAAILLRTNIGDYVANSVGDGYNIQASQRSIIKLYQLEITDPSILAAFPESLMEYQLRLHGTNATVDSMALVFTAETASEIMREREATGRDKGAIGCFSADLRFVSGDGCIDSN